FSFQPSSLSPFGSGSAPTLCAKAARRELPVRVLKASGRSYKDRGIPPDRTVAGEARGNTLSHRRGSPRSALRRDQVVAEHSAERRGEGSRPSRNTPASKCVTRA